MFGYLLLGVVVTSATVGLGFVLGRMMDPYTGHHQKRQRELRRAKLWSITDLPDGAFGRVVGTVKATGPTLTSPLSGRVCVYFSARAFILNRPDPIIDETQAGVFELEDGSGIATIDPDRAESALVPTMYMPGLVQPLPAIQTAFLEKHGYRYPGWTVYCSEHVVEVGATIAVIGFGSRKDGKLNMSSSPSFALILTDNRAHTHLELPIARMRRR